MTMHKKSLHIDLSPRQKEVMEAAALGEGMKDTAKRLKISIGTVKTHRDRARESCGGGNLVSSVALLVYRRILFP